MQLVFFLNNMYRNLNVQDTFTSRTLFVETLLKQYTVSIYRRLFFTAT